VDPEPTDGDLVRAHQRGDRAAFDALVRRYVRLAGGVAYGVLGDYEHAADAVQEAFIKAHDAVRDLREPDRFRGWLTGIVRTTSIDALRRRRRAPGALSAVEGGAIDLADSGARPAAGAEQGELRLAVLAAVKELPESYREVVIMKYLDERSYKEISEALGITIETIESRLFRARKLLKSRLEKFA
jgi:RNA polymerase sigma-70 factor (ECF subfamily)